MTSKKKKPLWTLEAGLTYSSLSLWDDCPEQFALTYIEGLTSNKLDIPLEFGSVFHACIEHQFDGSPQEISSRECKRYRTARLKKLSTPYDRQELDKILGWVMVLFPEYCEFWKEKDNDIQWVEREQKFEVMHPLMLHDETNRRIKIKGMRDGVYKTKDGYGLFETKTRGWIKLDEIPDEIATSMQILIYCHSMALEGHKPTGGIFNVIKRPSHKVLKKENLNSHLQRVKRDVQSRPEEYFLRWGFTVTEKDLSNFVSWCLDPLLREFVAWWSEVRLSPFERFRSSLHRKNYRRLIGPYGKARLYDVLVNQKENGFYHRSQVFPELGE